MPKYRLREKRDDRETGKRVFVVGAVIACCFAVLACRMLSFRLKNNDQLAKLAFRQYRTAVRKTTKRGKILDRKGRELAIDVMVNSVYADPREIKDYVKAAGGLSEILNVDRKHLLNTLSSKKKFVWMKRRVGRKLWERVKSLHIKGVYSMKESKRLYPGHFLGASVLGAVGFDSEPLGGVETAYDDELSFRLEQGKVKKDARGRLYISPSSSKDKSHGDVVLTLDRTIQFIAENELLKGIKKCNAKAGSAIVVDVNSGAVLAMANYPSFDPNEYSRYPVSHWRNRAITDAYEPGSTFKAIIISIALDDGVVKTNDVFDCENGKIEIGDKVIRDSHAHGKLTVADIIKVSSNIGAYKVEKLLSKKNLYNGILSFGFGRKTNIGLPGESVGVLSSYEKWSPVQRATIAFGQGISATPIQMAMAFCAIANGGTLYKPYIVKDVIDENSDKIEDYRPIVVRHPISKNAAHIMKSLLKRVVEEGGTGTLASSLEYTVAGKTGTAQKPNLHTGGYAKGKYYSSFIGFAPSSKPKIVVYVGVDEPSGKYYYGGQVAAPVFRKIIDETLKYMKVASDMPRDENMNLPNIDEAADVQKSKSINFNAQHHSELVDNFNVENGRMPNVLGMSMRDILSASRNIEIVWDFQGSGVAVWQSVKAGKIISRGEKCKVIFKPLLQR